MKLSTSLVITEPIRFGLSKLEAYDVSVELVENEAIAKKVIKELPARPLSSRLPMKPALCMV